MQSFLSIVTVLNTISTFLGMILLSPIPVFGSAFNRLPAGPTAIMFSIVYQYFRLVPQAYEFKVFGVTFSDKIWMYATACQVGVFLQPDCHLVTVKLTSRVMIPYVIVSTGSC